ncbi:MAG TPA: hypothetical protein ENK02_11305 [Planctomycetes bacterium]|nr:hypothetical protein [Planctomycetota bacterium]
MRWKKRNLFWGLVALFAFSPFSCRNSEPKEPEGTPVSLSQEDEAPKWIKGAKRTWYAWQTKGVSLVKAGRYDEALFCFHQAKKHWPKNVDGKNPGPKPKPEPTDTLFQMAFLFLKMKKPKLAIRYFEKFESYFPGNKIAWKGKKQAEEMLQKSEN